MKVTIPISPREPATQTRLGFIPLTVLTSRFKPFLPVFLGAKEYFTLFAQALTFLLLVSGRVSVPFDERQREHEATEARPQRLLSSPISDENIHQALIRIQQELRDVPNPRKLANRDVYVSELVTILEKCDRQDKFRLKIQLDQIEIVPVRISDRTAARVIRCLGDLEANEAAGVLTEFLLLPWDVPHHSAVPREGDMPAQWALFQIGDAALPHLRKKMVSDNVIIRGLASFVAESILGPRAGIQIREWIRTAKTAEEQNRLLEMRRTFEQFARNIQKGKTLEQYRDERLNRGRERLSTLLDSPSLDDAERESLERAKNQRRHE